MLVTSLEMCKAMQGRRRVDELVVEEVEDWESSHNSSPADRSSHHHCPSSDPLLFFDFHPNVFLGMKKMET